VVPVPSTAMPSTAGARIIAWKNPECARGPQGGRRSHRQLGRNRWACHGKKSPGLRGAPGESNGVWRLALAALPHRYLACRPCPGTGARGGKSFRLRPPGLTHIQYQDPKSVLRSTHGTFFNMQKTGHFYFALTTQQPCQHQSARSHTAPAARREADWWSGRKLRASPRRVDVHMRNAELTAEAAGH